MPVRLGQFYALVLLLTCLGINIAFFSEVREPFLGNEDPLTSVKSSLFELDIRGKIAGLYPQKQSQVDDVQDLTPAPPKDELHAPKAQRRQPTPPPAETKPAETKNVVSGIDPFQPSDPPPKAEPEKPLPKEALPKEVLPESSVPVSVVAPAESLQTAATMPVPQPAVAAVKPALASQFKPILPEPTSAVSVKPSKPSSSPVWDTVDTALERPIWYD